MAGAVSVNGRVLVSCAVCHIYFDASSRSARDYRSGKTEPRCMMHRRRGARPQTKTAELRRWWLDRFELSEIQVMANHIFPRGTERGNALTAALRDMNR